MFDHRHYRQSQRRSRGYCLRRPNPFAMLCAKPHGDSPGPRAAGKRLDGFNERWIDFEGEKATVLNGQVNLETLLGALVLEAG